ncbi:uncharacterized protein [Solanum tuberosum]|uniref:uncharacterized protein n=1 Tax=Solanum tuberosum TaxID=4113 RepID=UPI00073A2EB6|nr:PREDICTED: uncharacterized protein LOC107062644 [Solanum tuberosum]
MANSAAAKVEGTGKVHLKMASGKVMTLNRVLYVLELQKNLVSIPVLTKNGFKCVFVSDKVIVTKNEMKSFVCLYVDDMLIMSKDIANVKATKRMLASKFDMKDLGVADLILGIKIHKTPNATFSLYLPLAALGFDRRKLDVWDFDWAYSLLQCKPQEENTLSNTNLELMS